MLVASLVVGLVYMSLGLQARRHLNAEASASDRSVGWLFWWSFAKSSYDEEGQRLCRKADLFAYAGILLIVGWHVVLLR